MTYRITENVQRPLRWVYAHTRRPDAVSLHLVRSTRPVPAGWTQYVRACHTDGLDAEKATVVADPNDAPPEVRLCRRCVELAPEDA